MLQKKLCSLYNNPKECNQLFSINIIEEIRLHMEVYYEIQTMEVVHALSKLKERLIRSNLPVEISSLQNIFIESFSFSILAIYEVSISSRGRIPGVDSLCFFSLKQYIENYQKKSNT